MHHALHPLAPPEMIIVVDVAFGGVYVQVGCTTVNVALQTVLPPGPLKVPCVTNVCPLCAPVIVPLDGHRPPGHVSNAVDVALVELHVKVESCAGATVEGL